MRRPFAQSHVMAAVACAVVTMAAPAFAQHRAAPAASEPKWDLDGAIGLAAPVGNFGTGLSSGIDLMGAAEVWMPSMAPFGLRGEIGYNHFGANYVNGHASTLRFLVDAVYDVPVQHTTVQPYLLAGFGLYHVSGVVDFGCVPFGCTVSDGSTGVGLNLGGGIRVPLGTVQGFFEARYHLPFTGLGGLSTSPFFPFQIGIRYPLPS